MQTRNLDKWNFVLSDLESPQLFIDYTWWWTIGSALQRRVYMGDYKYAPIFPNPFIMFVADSGVGKSMSARLSGAKILKTFKYIDKQKVANGFPADKCWVDLISFSADDTTLQSLIQQLNQSTRTFQFQNITPDGLSVTTPVQHASMCILLSEEMTTLFKVGADEVCSFLNQSYDAQDYFKKTKTQGEDNVKNVCVSFLGCTTPDNVKKLMRANILQQGFTARVWPVYAEGKRHREVELIFNKEQLDSLIELQKHVAGLTQISGNVTFSSEAREWFKLYYEGDNPKDMTKKSPLEKDRINLDKRCDDFYGRIKVHIHKMAMLCHFSDFDGTLVIKLPTLQYAIGQLGRIQPQMHLALASTGNNPMFEYYKKIYEYIKVNELVSKTNLKLYFSEDLQDMELEDVLKFLGETGKVKFSASYSGNNIKLKGKAGYIAI